MATTEVLLFKGDVGAGPVSSEGSQGAQCVWERLVLHTQGGAYERWCTHKEARTPLQEACDLKGVRGLAPTSSEVSQGAEHVEEGLVVHTQGGAYTRQGAYSAICSYHRSLVR